jgi:hypothetical protein
MASNVKLRLRAGDFEIEVEGTHTDVVAILEKYWTPTASSGGSDVPQKRQPARPKRSNARARAASADADADDDNDDSLFDAHKLANEMKQDDRFEAFTEKVLHQRDQWNKIALVLWYAKREMTSGAIQKVLSSLNVRMKRQNVTKVMARETSKLLSDVPRKPGAKVPYRLESRASAAFEKWLLSDER